MKTGSQNFLVTAKRMVAVATILYALVSLTFLLRPTNHPVLLEARERYEGTTITDRTCYPEPARGRYFAAQYVLAPRLLHAYRAECEAILK